MGSVDAHATRQFVNFPPKRRRESKAAAEIPEPLGSNSQRFQDFTGFASADSEILTTVFKRRIDLFCDPTYKAFADPAAQGQCL
jgi:hypothetical protein